MASSRHFGGEAQTPVTAEHENDLRAAPWQP
jgi:hypothetical protein